MIIHTILGGSIYSLQTLPHRSNVASLSLFYRYFNAKISDEFLSFVRSVQAIESFSFHPYSKHMKKSYTHAAFSQEILLYRISHSENASVKTSTFLKEETVYIYVSCSYSLLLSTTSSFIHIPRLFHDYHFNRNTLP